MKQYRIGTVVKPHGLKGEVKVYPHTDDLSRFEDATYLIVGGTEEKLEVQSIREQKGMIFLKFKDKNTIESIEYLLRKELYVDGDNMRELEEDEYMIDTLIGLEVYLEDDTKIGVVTDFLQYTANDVFVITLESGQKAMIPFLKQFVPKIDMEHQKMIIRPIKGMIEE